MTGIETALTRFCVSPKRGSKEFSDWIKQDDTSAFLSANARGPEILIYAVLDHVYLQTVTVPANRLEAANLTDLREWELMQDKWSLNYSFGGTDSKVWLEPPFASEKCNVFREAEQLIYCRSFAGLDDEKTYYELLQKFAHIFELHYVQHRKSYCRLDENGNLEDVVRILDLKHLCAVGSGTAIVMQRRVLDEYLLAGGRVAVRAFDFTRFDSNSIEGWGDERVEKHEEDAEFSYRLTVEPGSGSYMRGIQLIRPLETISQYHDRLTRRDDSREYASFVAQDWKNRVIREISCAPGATANYFTKSDSPYETTPAFFRPEVLTKYKSDPSKYTLEERSISCRGAWSLRTYDINEAGQVHTYLVYLRDLPYAEQLYWKAFNEEPKAPLSKRAIGTDFEGQFWA